MKRFKYLLLAIPLFAIASWEMDFDDDFASASKPNGITPSQYLVAGYKLASNANDMSGNGFNGTWSASEKYTTLSSKTGAEFIQSNYISNVPSTAFGVSSNMTLCAWIWTTNTLVSTGHIITSDAGTGNREWQFGIEQSGEIRFLRFNQAEGLAEYITTTERVNNGAWTHISASFSVANGSKIYINGVLVKSNTVLDAGKDTATKTLTIGGRLTNEKFLGLISDAYIFRKELSITDINRVKDNQNPTYQ
jgi:hypothetical protein